MLDRLLESKEIKLEVVLVDNTIRTFSIKVNDKTIKEAVCVAMINSALKGDMQAINTIMERTDGKVPVRISPEDSGPAQIMIVENTVTEKPKELENNGTTTGDNSGNDTDLPASGSVGVYQE